MSFAKRSVLSQKKEDDTSTSTSGTQDISPFLQEDENPAKVKKTSTMAETLHEALTNFQEEMSDKDKGKPVVETAMVLETLVKSYAVKKSFEKEMKNQEIQLMTVRKEIMPLEILNDFLQALTHVQEEVSETSLEGIGVIGNLLLSNSKVCQIMCMIFKPTFLMACLKTYVDEISHDPEDFLPQLPLLLETIAKATKHCDGMDFNALMETQYETFLSIAKGVAVKDQKKVFKLN